jgi:hypothetical protein
MKSEKKYASTPKRARPEIPYAVRTQAPRPAKRLLADEWERDCVELESEEEMLGARSSMPEKPPNGKIVAQVHYASRLPGVMAGQDYLSRILLRFLCAETKKL